MLDKTHTKEDSRASRHKLYRSQRYRGQAMVEFALGSALFLVVMLVAIQYAILGQAALAVSQGASALARYAAVNPGVLGYNGSVPASSLPAAAQQLLSPSILTSSAGTSDLTVTVNSYTGSTTTQTSTPIQQQDRVVIAMSYNAAGKLVLPNPFMSIPPFFPGLPFPTALAGTDSQLYE
jgi:Flp pilus assembly protein TadG